MMRTFFRRLSKIAIGLFCLYHMAAIASYAFPGEIHDLVRYRIQKAYRSTAVLDRVDTFRWNAFGKYVLTTSQWQIWNLFSPNPMRDVLKLEVQKWSKEDRRWVLAVIVDPQKLSGWRSARDAKILYGVTYNWEDDRPVRKRLLETFCKNLELPENTLVRLVFYSYTIPNYNVSSSAFWKRYEPRVTTYPDVSSRCSKPV